MELGELVLERPLEMMVEVDPPTGPDGERWVMMVAPSVAGVPSGDPFLGRTDPEGRFRQEDLRPGSYALILSDARGTRLHTETVELDSGQTHFTIEVTTVDASGEPIAEARVLAIAVPATGRPAHLKTDEEGEVSFRGNHLGAYRLEAHGTSSEGRKLRSTSREVHLSEESPSATARLVLQSMKQLRGRVLSAAGPVPGAEVKVRYVGQGAGTRPMIIPPIRLSNAAEFSLDVPPEIEQVDLVVMARGFVIKYRRVVLEAGNDIEILLDHTGGGTLEIEIDKNPTTYEFGDRLPFVFYEGFRFDLRDLQRWAVLNGASKSKEYLEIPLLPPGRYELCRPTGENNWVENNRVDKRCKSGFLSAFGQLVFDGMSHEKTM